MLGKKGKDVITGFEGVIIGKVKYLTGCNQYLLSGPSLNGKVGESNWFDTDRVEILDGDAVVLLRTYNGSDMPAPIH
jgi:hypothetical protein